MEGIVDGWKPFSKEISVECEPQTISYLTQHFLAFVDKERGWGKMKTDFRASEISKKTIVELQAVSMCSS